MKLNNKQHLASSQIEGPMMVLAGPGTGKTQIIASRIANILRETQMEPSNILCLTFTESGVSAMRKRLISLIGSSAYHVKVHTFHSFCNEIIQNNPEIFFQTRSLESLDDVEQVKIFRALIDDLEHGDILKPFGDTYKHQRDLISKIRILKQEEVSPEKLKTILEDLEAQVAKHKDFLESFVAIHGTKVTDELIEEAKIVLKDTCFQMIFNEFSYPLEKKERTSFKNKIKKEFESILKNLPKQKSLLKIYSGYLEKLESKGRYDFEDMIIFVIKALRSHDSLLAKIQEQFQYILVDEYQDTNGAQNELVEIISGFFENPNLFVVGDDKQSIYRFQGASLENILYFYKRYQDSIKVVSLEENYRSHQGILDASYDLIQNANQSLQKIIPSADGFLKSNLEMPARPIEFYEFDQISSEHYFLVKKIKALIDSGTTASEIAVFFKTNKEADPLVDLFIRMNLPFRLERGENVLEDTRIKQLINILKLIQNPNDASVLLKILHADFLNFPTWNIHKLFFEHSRSKAQDGKREDILELMRDSEIFNSFFEKLFSWIKTSHNKPLIELVDHVLRDSGYLDFIMKQEDKVQHLNKLNSFFGFVKEMNRSKHDLSIEEFLEHLNILEENKIAIKEHELATSKNAVRLMTAHKSKGLEFEHVFIINCVDKNWGNAKQMDYLKLPTGILKYDLHSSADEKNEDDRRLFYVAMTRAKHNLYLSYSKSKSTGKDQVYSIFINEIGEKHLQKIDTGEVENEAFERLQTIFLEVPKQDREEEEKAFMKALLENYKLSVTHLNSYLKCPRYFYYQSLLRVPSANTKRSSLGTAVHEALSELSRAYKKTGEVPNKEFVLEQYKISLKKQILSPQDFESALEEGKQILSEYYDAHKDEFCTNMESEYDFSHDNINFEDIVLTGKLDQVIFNDEDETLHVVDLKTGQPDSKYKELKPDGNYYRQLVFYKLLCDLSPRLKHKMKSGEIKFVEKSKKSNAYTSTIVQVSNEDLEILKDQIRSTMEDIKSFQFLSKDSFRFCGECEYCKMIS